MKKNFLLSVLAGLMVVGSAFAAPTPEQRKEMCLKHPNKYVWVEKTQACIEKNPCKSDDNVIQKAYCNRVFADLELPWETAGEYVAEAYIKNVLHTTGSYLDNLGRNATMHVWGQDYMDYKLSDGGYVVFEFDDLMDESAGATASHPGGLNLGGDSLKKFRADNAIKGALLAFGYNDISAVQDKTSCEKIASLATDIFSVTFDNVFRYEMRDGVCEIYLVMTTTGQH